MEGSLTGRLLIAAPQLVDYFRRTVVLVLSHSDEGALGVVLNRPTGTAVAEAVPALADLAGEDALVHSGGPVDPSSVLALGDVDGTPELIVPEDTDGDLRRVRVFAGYAGWGPGQLDDEIEQEAWITAAAAPDDPFAESDLWPEVLQRKGGGYALMATMPVDPTLN
jgi:putative transcriptional regulator